MSPIIFWPLWMVFAIISTVVWTYGEMGTIAWDLPGAPFIWLVGFILGVASGVAAGAYAVGDFLNRKKT